MTAGAFLQQLQECSIKIRTINAECISGGLPGCVGIQGNRVFKKITVKWHGNCNIIQKNQRIQNVVKIRNDHMEVD